ncbi:hypothetical protein [Amycolatopsis anabasis]|uniref:hypothetical protein n=1 Tax=Amycolatopsis anabasis TaxID=1840409 RepID=UPI00131C2000|nr:hypothetical protein [Amycolatopsis anabasis]
MNGTTAADREYYRAQQRIVRQAANQVQRAWTELDTETWPELRPELVAAITEGQADAAALAPRYIAATLAAAGAVSNPLGELVARGFAGRAANGLSLARLVDFAFSLYRRAIGLGMPPSEARAAGLARALLYTSTEVADAGRLAVQVGSVLEPEIAGHERIVHLPACGRCTQLAGRLYRNSTGFLRHPRCDCSMKPVTREQWRTQRPGNNPRALFTAMTPEQQEKAFGKGGAAAIRAGADLSRVVNARRKGAVYVAGGHEYTREAITSRGVGRQLGDLKKRPGRRYRTSGVARPTPAQLVNSTRDEPELTEQLRRFGYLH